MKKNKFFKLFFILIITFVFFEIFLFTFARFAGGERQNKIEIKEETINILTLGDSFVYGVDLPREETFQFYLENKLNNFFSKKEFRVINKGAPGTNTHHIINNLENNLKKYSPHFVIIKAGMNNYKNFTGLKGDKIKEKIFIFLNNLRTVRFLKNILSNASEKENEGEQLKVDFKLIEKSTKDKLKKDITQVENKITNWQLQEAHQKLSELEKSLGNSGKYALYPVKARICFLKQELEKGVDYLYEYYKRADNKGKNRVENILIDNAVSVQKFDIYAEITGDIIDDKKELDNRITKWLKNDIEKIIQIVRLYGAIPVIMNYFELELPVVREAARDKNVIFIDNFFLFKSHCRQNRLKQDNFFLPDRHLNTEGNKLLADFLYKPIKREFKQY
ncbi:MAG: SGNH/GDSL hydrolase family protein [Candidatus Muiribacteriota bacterium]